MGGLRFIVSEGRAVSGCCDSSSLNRGGLKGMWFIECAVSEWVGNNIVGVVGRV